MRSGNIMRAGSEAHADAAACAPATGTSFDTLPAESRKADRDGKPFAHSDLREGVFGLDPRTHLLAIAVTGASALLITGLLETALLQVVCALYLAGNGRVKLACRCCLSFAAVCALSFVPLPGLYGVLFVSLMHMVPPFTAGCSLFTLSPSAIMCALSRWHVPERVLIGVCMVFRFASVLVFEAKSIVRGIRMRGIFSRWFDIPLHPALAYECFYTPLVMRCLRLSSELAASSELRGIEAGETRTSVYHVGFGVRDAAVAVVLASLCVLLYAGGAFL